MIIIKNSKQLAKLVDKNKDLIIPGEDIRIEFEPSKDEIRDVECRNLYLEFDFNGGNFNGGDFNGGSFNGGSFNGGDFNGNDFNGNNFNGKKASYWAFFNCYGSIKCESIEGRREPHAEPVALDNKIEIVKPEEKTLTGKKKSR